MTTRLSKKIYASLLRLSANLGSFFGVRTTHLPDFVLCYHDISNNSWDFSTSPKVFADQISYLIKKFQVVSLEEILKPSSQDRTRVAITFDDGFSTVFSHAFPILSSHHVTATVFVVDKPSMNLSGSKQSKLLTTIEIKKLKESGWTIGYHTSNHQDLTRLSTSKLKNELFNNKLQLERKLGTKFSYLAYPFGKSNKKVASIVMSAGFKAAFLVDGKYLSTSKDQFALGRITISAQHTPAIFRQLLTRIGIFINYCFTSLWRFKDNL